MSLQNFKNLIKPSLFNDDSFQPLLKKSDQHKKTTQVALLHMQSIVKNFDAYEVAYQKLLADYEQHIETNEIIVPQYYQKYMQLFRNIWSEQKTFDQKLTNSLRQLIALCDSLFGNFSNRILTFQGYIRSYKAHELILAELAKKYSRTNKMMSSNIDNYKQTFTDVKIIYNIDEKIKRYNVCETTHRTLQEELSNINKKVTQLSEQKTKIVQAYQDIDKDFVLTIKAIGNKLISISKSFVSEFCDMQKIVIAYLAQNKFTLEKIQLKTFFNADTKINYSEYFKIQIDPKNIQFHPVFVAYHQDIKEEYYYHLGKLFSAVAKQTEQKIQNRKKLSKKVLEFTSNFIKIHEKFYYFGLKEVVGNYQKLKKNLSELFGPKLCSFMKSIIAIFQLSVGINQKLIKRTLAKLKTIQTHLLEQTKVLDLFKNEFKNNIDKFINNKNIKKLISQRQINQFTEEEPAPEQISQFKTSIADKSQHLAILIDGFVQKFKKNYDQLKFQYNAVVNDLSVSNNQFYSLCCEYQELYFGQDQFVKNFKKYETDINTTLDTQRKFFQQINFGALLKEDQGPITFDPEIGRIQEYKKLKKPASIQVQQERTPEVNPKGSSNSETSIKDQQKSPGQGKKSSGQAKKEPVKVTSKHHEFLLTKVSFYQGETFFKSFSCALSDKILLSGRVYITNKRICFHSSFNTSTLFFEQTFLQIPKNDIKKIQKRFNAIVFDNSISITTVNGQVFLTSFFSRNQAYDLICQALELDIGECMFEPEEIKEVEAPQQVPEEDDLKIQSLPERQQNINKILNDFPYKQIFKTQYAYPGFNAYRYLKTFQLGGQFTFNRKTYKNFQVYIKQILDHKDYQFEEWGPQKPQDFLNSSNIKASTPLSFTRKINCMVPVSNTGVPFMPKQSKSQQTLTLFIFSKDKFIFESSIQNSGIPYSQTFNLKIRRIVQSINQNCCQASVSLFINFITTPMIKSIIESKTTEECKTSFLKIQTEGKKYLNYLERTKLKAKSPDNLEINGNNNNTEEYQKQISELKQSQQTLKTELKTSNLKIQQGKKILLGSLLLNILLILILLS